jgi:hypothetical protein
MRACHKWVIPAGNTFCLVYMSRQADYLRVNSSLIGESVMDNIAGLVPGLADGRGPRDSITGVAGPLFCHLVIGRASAAGRRTVRR